MFREHKPVNTAVKILLICLTLAGVFWAVFFVREVNKKAGTIADLLGADIIVIPEAAADNACQFVVADVEKPLYLPSGTLERLQKEPGVERLTYQIHLGKPPSDCCTYIDGPIIAFEEKSDFIITPFIAERRKDGLLTTHEVLEGGKIHDYLGLITDILLFNNNTRITGYLKYSGTNFDNCVFMRVEDIASISHEDLPDYPSGSVSVIFVRLSAAGKVSELTEKIQKSYPGIAVIRKGSFLQRVRAFL